MGSPSFVLFGKNGQLARALQAFLKPCVVLGREDVDFTKPDDIERRLNQACPHVVVNAAAYTNVELAEQDAHTVMMINSVAPEKIAGWCAKNQAVFVHYSTDYVFSGDKHTPYTEEDTPNPLNEYGRSKLAGEEAIIRSGCKYFILRTAWLFGRGGHNFVNTMLKIGAQQEVVKVVCDQVGSPTFVDHLASASYQCLHKILENDEPPSGVFHLTHAGETSWHGFAQEIFRLARRKNISLCVKAVTPILSKDYPSKVKRPAYSVLSNRKIWNEFSIRMPSWQEGLEDFFYENH